MSRFYGLIFPPIVFYTDRSVTTKIDLGLSILLNSALNISDDIIEYRVPSLWLEFCHTYFRYGRLRKYTCNSPQARLYQLCCRDVIAARKSWSQTPKVLKKVMLPWEVSWHDDVWQEAVTCSHLSSWGIWGVLHGSSSPHVLRSGSSSSQTYHVGFLPTGGLTRTGAVMIRLLKGTADFTCQFQWFNDNREAW